MLKADLCQTFFSRRLMVERLAIGMAPDCEEVSCGVGFVDQFPMG